MIQRCPVLLNNDAVTVFQYNDVDVQVRSIGRKAEYVDVLYENDKYTVLNENEKPSIDIAQPSKDMPIHEAVESNSRDKMRRRKKKTTTKPYNKE